MDFGLPVGSGFKFGGLIFRQMAEGQVRSYLCKLHPPDSTDSHVLQ